MRDTYHGDYLLHTTFRFHLIDLQLNTDFPFQFCVFWPQNHLTLLKDRFLKKMLSKRAKTRRFFRKHMGSNNSLTKFYKFKKIQVFKIAKFEFKATVHYGLWANAPSCDRLRPQSVFVETDRAVMLVNLLTW